MENNKTKMPLSFLANAISAAKAEIQKKYNAATVVSATASYTVFWHKGQCLALSGGNLSGQVEAPFCVELDLRYSSGEVIVLHQRLHTK